MTEEQINGVSPKEESGTEKALTPIHRRIHCAATTDTMQPDGNELDQIAIDHFLGTLAEVALSVARRRQQLDS